MSTRVRFKDFARWTLSRYGFASNERMIKFLSSILKVKTFEDLQIPLAVTATDFSTGAGVVFHSGPLVDPVRASCAYPGMFLPVKIRGRLLVDGMLAHAVPTVPLREMGAQTRAGGTSQRDLDQRRYRSAASVRRDRPVLRHCPGDELRSLEGGRRPGHRSRREWIQIRRFRTLRGINPSGEAATRAALPEIRKWLQQPEPARKPQSPA
jgi:predicted acylesterase/phospholipase RssA